MVDQYIRNAISFVGAFVVVFGGLYLVDYYSGWRPFAEATAEINESATRQAANGFSGPQDETVGKTLRLDENISIPKGHAH